MLFPTARLALATLASLIVLAGVPARAGTTSFSPLDTRLIEKTTLVPPAQSVTAYTVPADGRVVLTRFCGDTCIWCEGATLGHEAFAARGSRCIEHPRGIELPPGETVRCTNHCRTMSAALFSGTLRP